MCSWKAPFQSGCLIGYLCLDETVSVPDWTEAITSPHVRKSRTVLDSGFHSLLEFRIPWAVLRIPKPRIPDSISKFFFRFRFPLHGRNHNTTQHAAQAVRFFRVVQENRKEMCGACTVQCTLFRSGCFFLLWLNLILDLLTSCVWDLFYSLKQTGSTLMFVVTGNRSTLSHSMYECRDESLQVQLDFDVNIFFLQNWCSLCYFCNHLYQPRDHSLFQLSCYCHISLKSKVEPQAAQTHDTRKEFKVIYLP